MKPEKLPVSRDSAYQSWDSMRRRCNDPMHKDYPRYGGCGVKHDLRWHNFEWFLADMGARPEGTTLDRFPNKNGDYEKSNCRWATFLQQNLNRRLVYSNKTGVTGVSQVSIGYRAYGKIHGKSIELYRGPSFNSAVQARKTWEKQNET